MARHSLWPDRRRASLASETFGVPRELAASDQWSDNRAAQTRARLASPNDSAARLGRTALHTPEVPVPEAGVVRKPGKSGKAGPHDATIFTGQTPFRRLKNATSFSYRYPQHRAFLAPHQDSGR